MMFQFNSKVLARMVAVAGMASVTGLATAATTINKNVTATATLVSACEVTAGTIDFGNITTLASSLDQVVDSGSTFTVACSSDLSPTIASATQRTMKDTATTPNSLPFNLSLVAGAAADNFPATATALAITKDGTPQTVRLYAKVAVGSFTGANALPAGIYSKTLVVDVGY